MFEMDHGLVRRESLRLREFGIRMAIGARPSDFTGIVGWLAVRRCA